MCGSRGGGVCVCGAQVGAAPADALMAALRAVLADTSTDARAQPFRLGSTQGAPQFAFYGGGHEPSELILYQVSHLISSAHV
jgi:hypothetical protein